MAKQKFQRPPADKVQADTVDFIEGLNPENRSDAKKIFQISNLVRTASFSVDRDAVGTVAVPYSSELARNLLHITSEIDGIMDSFNRSMTGTERTISFSESVETAKVAQKTEETLNKTLEALKTTINECFEKGFGSRRDLQQFQEQKEDVEKQKIKQFIQDGKPLDSFIEKIDILSKERIENLYTAYVYDFISSKREDIKELVTQGKDVDDIAKILAIPAAQLKKMVTTFQKEMKKSNVVEEKPDAEDKKPKTEKTEKTEKVEEKPKKEEEKPKV